jgi:hypothetical protein
MASHTLCPNLSRTNSLIHAQHNKDRDSSYYLFFEYGFRLNYYNQRLAWPIIMTWLSKNISCSKNHLNPLESDFSVFFFFIFIFLQAYLPSSGVFWDKLSQMLQKGPHTTQYVCILNPICERFLPFNSSDIFVSADYSSLR